MILLSGAFSKNDALALQSEQSAAGMMSSVLTEVINTIIKEASMSTSGQIMNNCSKIRMWR